MKIFINQFNLCNELSKEIKKHLKTNKICNLFVSGGKSPKELFDKLSKKKLEWDRINIFLVDERITNTNSDDSNTKLVKDNLIKNNAKLVKFYSCMNETYENDYEKLEKFANSIYKTPDILILGMGTDAHTASIFPNTNNLDDLLNNDNKAYHVVKGKNYNRITLNLASIKKAKKIFLNISGEEKFQVFLTALKEKNKQYPISFLLNENLDINVFCKRI